MESTHLCLPFCYFPEALRAGALRWQGRQELCLQPNRARLCQAEESPGIRRCGSSLARPPSAGARGVEGAFYLCPESPLPGWGGGQGGSLGLKLLPLILPKLGRFFSLVRSQPCRCKLILLWECEVTSFPEPLMNPVLRTSVISFPPLSW